MESFNIEKFNTSVARKEYVKGKETDFYILTAKFNINKYKLILLENHSVIYESFQDSLTEAKHIGIERLYIISPSILDARKVTMVHYKEDRPSGKPWVKDSEPILSKYLNLDLEENEYVFPPLQPRDRNREFNQYDKDIRSKVIFEYLFNERTHRWLDENIIKLDPAYSRGYQSMGILHHLGLRDTHKGIFMDINIEEGIKLLSRVEHENIKTIVESLTYSNELAYVHIDVDDVVESIEYQEGKESFRMHKFRERNSKLISEAKKAFKIKHGKLFCEACGINFEKVYGERGKDFIEAHHTKPVAEMKLGEKTRIEDIAMLCSNCHRMIHKSPTLSVTELKRYIKESNF
ncbi:hypothetical protein JOC86_004508 [Bacillus pakistanensis]|uniref:HNH domain-containing protein n=1 Tax=Rossellomorea pakistanensis TaxID=992288 RepID=A0ABS2NJD8_9BACI|nr:HNH endonuclease [Bacillus pakistanensis]MBM7587933.1 hypothetical protein [Bacillus pakistanensis]